MDGGSQFGIYNKYIIYILCVFNLAEVKSLRLTMLLPRAITNTPIPSMRSPLSNCWLEESKRLPKQYKLALGCISEAEGKYLLLKTPYT